METFINMNKLLIRPLVDKDWKIINSWREQGWMAETTNDSVLTLASNLSHCQLTVIVDENGNTTLQPFDFPKLHRLIFA